MYCKMDQMNVRRLGWPWLSNNRQCKMVMKTYLIRLTAYYDVSKE